jgi:hypothetical protein
MKIKQKKTKKKNCRHLIVKRPNPNGRGARRPRNAKGSSAFKSTFKKGGAKHF